MKSKVLSVLSTWKFWRELIVMTLGISVGAAAVNYFLVPSKLIIGSISGLAIVFSTLLEDVGVHIGVSLMVLLINIVLLILAMLLIGKEFGLKTVYTSLILGPLIELWEKVLPYERLVAPGQGSIMGDPWFDLLCFVLMLSVSQAILFRINASTGGLDILAKIVNKYFHLDIGTSVTVAGAVICCTAFFINPPRLVIIGLIGTWINGLAVDYFTASLNRKKRVCIICAEHEKIRSYIIDTLCRGCTLYPIKGGFSREDGIEIEAILSKDEFASLMSFIKDSNLNAFITSGNVSEVYGKWNDRKHNV